MESDWAAELHNQLWCGQELWQFSFTLYEKNGIVAKKYDDITKSWVNTANACQVMLKISLNSVVLLHKLSLYKTQMHVCSSSVLEVLSSTCPFRHTAPLHLTRRKHDPIWDCGKVAPVDGVAQDYHQDNQHPNSPIRAQRVHTFLVSYCVMEQNAASCITNIVEIFKNLWIIFLFLFFFYIGQIYKENSFRRLKRWLSLNTKVLNILTLQDFKCKVRFSL